MLSAAINLLNSWSQYRVYMFSIPSFELPFDPGEHKIELLRCNSREFSVVYQCGTMRLSRELIKGRKVDKVLITLFLSNAETVMEQPIAGCRHLKGAETFFCPN